MKYAQKFKLFHEIAISSFLRKKDSQNEILNAEPEVYTKYLIETFTIEPLDFYFDDKSIEHEEQDIPVTQHPRDFTIWHSGMRLDKIKRMVLTYFIPFSGNKELFRVQPSSFSKEFYINDNNLCFDIIDFYNDSEKIKTDAQSYLDYIKQFSSYLHNDISHFNNTLEKLNFLGKKL